MSSAKPLWFADLLECPDCGAPLSAPAPPEEFRCAGCGQAFPVRDGQLHCVVSPGAVARLDVAARQSDVEWPPWRPPPDGTYRGPCPPRTSGRHLSVLAARSGRLDVLDWGCGTAAYRDPVGRVLGHRYVAVDVGGEGADVLADLHRLPFRAASLDHVITAAVLEHLATPVLAVREVTRVLKPGGVFSGCAAFLEPYHMRSHFHLAPDGLIHVLRTAGLVVENVWPQEGWTVFHSLAEMPGPVSGVSRCMFRRLAALERRIRSRWLHPREIPSGRWLRRKSLADLHAELLWITGQIDFVARRP